MSAAGAPPPSPSYTHLQRIARRRSRRSVLESEFSGGISERLFPDLPRLPALHEVHFSDTVVREVESTAFFQSSPTAAASSPHEADEELLADDEEEAALPLETEVEGGSASCSESCQGDVAESAGELTTVDGSASVSTAKSLSFGMEPLSSLLLQGGRRGGESRDDASLSSLPTINLITPLSQEDCVCLLTFVLHLRNETTANLPTPSMRRIADSAIGTSWTASHHVELRSYQKASAHPSLPADEPGASPEPPLQFSHIMEYLETAPPPVRGFTEDLQEEAEAEEGTPNSAYTCRVERERPAFLFTLYLENIAVSNAIGHMALLFSIPIRSFHTRSTCGKMSCSAVWCGLAPGTLCRHHLLLLNTMRHPGFVLRVFNVRAMPQVPHTATGVRDFFGSLARWQPLYMVDMLLRRVGSRADGEHGGLEGFSGPREAIEARLTAVQQHGAIHFCLQREPSLARAATDVIHLFYKSALINALQRPMHPLPMKQFLSAPNEVTASRARAASSDATVRAALKAFLTTKGNWEATVKQTPYAWRRRWINALRCLVWNSMASRRIRYGHRTAANTSSSTDGNTKEQQQSLDPYRVLIGDVVVRPEFMEDVSRRQVLTLKAEALKVVETAAEAEQYTLDHVFVPFLRGVYPEALFAPETSEHPIMRRSAMLQLLKEKQAAALLVGLPPHAQQVLDARSNRSPTLFRKLMVRPLLLEAEVLEDRPPMAGSVPRDSCRLLRPDRWDVAQTTPTITTGAAASELSSSPWKSEVGSALIPQTDVLTRTSLSNRLPPGVSPEDYFASPSPSDYLVLSQAQRHDSAASSTALLPTTPLTPPSQLQDRVYTLYIRAVCHSTAVGLAQMLREYFLLMSVKEGEGGSAAGSSANGEAPEQVDLELQHKVHRFWRELDPETAVLTAPIFCETCFNRDHSSATQCAEYHHKRLLQRQAREQEDEANEKGKRSTGGQQRQRGADGNTALRPRGRYDRRYRQSEAMMGNAFPGFQQLLLSTASGSGHSSLPLLASSSSTPSLPDPSWVTGEGRVWMRWHLRRPHRGVRWGVQMKTSTLVLTGAHEPELIDKGQLWCEWEEKRLDQTDTQQQGQKRVMSLSAALSQWAVQGETQQQLLRFLQTVFSSPAAITASRDVETAEWSGPTIGEELASTAERVAIHSSSSTGSQEAVNAAGQPLTEWTAFAPCAVLRQWLKGEVAVHDGERTTKSSKAEGGELLPAQDVNPLALQECVWRLRRINQTPVNTAKDVGAAMSHSALELTMVFSSPAVPLAAPPIAVSPPPPPLPAFMDSLELTLTEGSHNKSSSGSLSWGVSVSPERLTLTNLRQVLSRVLREEQRVREQARQAIVRSTTSNRSSRRMLKNETVALLRLETIDRSASVSRSISVASILQEHLAAAAKRRKAPENRSQEDEEVEYVITHVNGRVIRSVHTLAAAMPKVTQGSDYPPQQQERQKLCIRLRRRGAVNEGTCDEEVGMLVPGVQQAMPHRRTITVAVHRPLAAATARKWGARLQLQSKRLLHLQSTEGFHFRLYAASSSILKKVERVLMQQGRYHTHLLFVASVDHKKMIGPTEVREALKEVSPERDSMLLVVEDYVLLRVTLHLSRGGSGVANSGSETEAINAYTPFGVDVDGDVCIARLTHDSPVHRALMEAELGQQLSLWDYFTAPAEELAEAAEGDSSTVRMEAVTKQLRHVLALPSLAPLLSALFHSLLQSPAGAKFYYEQDDDEDAEAASRSSKAAQQQWKEKVATAAVQLTQRGEELKERLQSLSHVDGVQVLQLEAVLLFAETIRAATAAVDLTDDKLPGPLEVGELLKDLGMRRRLVRWKVVYAKEADKLIRSPADLCAALAPGVLEETITLQQCAVV